jgi:hypothetical protein
MEPSHVTHVSEPAALDNSHCGRLPPLRLARRRAAAALAVQIRSPCPPFRLETLSAMSAISAGRFSETAPAARSGAAAIRAPRLQLCVTVTVTESTAARRRGAPWSQGPGFAADRNGHRQSIGARACTSLAHGHPGAAAATDPAAGGPAALQRPSCGPSHAPVKVLAAIPHVSTGTSAMSTTSPATRVTWRRVALCSRVRPAMWRAARHAGVTRETRV